MSLSEIQRMRVIDSHTGGEPTRVIVEGGPNLGDGTMAERLHAFRSQFDRYRSAVVNEPRGSDVMVGALIQEPLDPACAAGVIFFNNVGYLGMCGHGTIGLITTLAHLGRIAPGEHRIETPVGIITTVLHENGEVSVQNVPSYRFQKKVEVYVEDYGPVWGDVAWGGNWFFLVEYHGQKLLLENVDALTEFAVCIRRALERNFITGKDGAKIDHIELFSPSPMEGLNSRNFVLCPGHAYDRSPCGTGTSAKLACLFSEGQLKEGEVWRQESIVGSVFEGTIHRDGDNLIPTIRGRAYVNGDVTLLIHPDDPFGWGIRQDSLQR